ncbi:MAG: hypothetical protein JW881_05450 [Spirochaetales bacterium]|nr:hypothetical protein [Spirochaetales bacterium]
MVKSKIKSYWKEYSSNIVRLDRFAIQKMGLLQSQTLLKIENYIIICAPYQVSMKKALLFAVLNERELPFFTQYLSKLAALKFTFQKDLKGIPLKFFVWAIIDRIEPIKGKENMCLIEVSYKSYPEALITIIGEFLAFKANLRKQYEKLKDRHVFVNNDTSRLLKFNNYIECHIGKRTVEAKLISLSVNNLTLSIPGVDPNLKEGYGFVSKLYFQTYRFNVKGTIGSIEKNVGGFLKIIYEIEYVPELTEILWEYFENAASRAG